MDRTTASEAHMNDKPAVRPKVSVGRALRAVGRDIITEARAPIDDHERADAVAVHDFRKAMKRWRAQLRLIEPFLGADGVRLRHEARDLARALAGARDAQAALNALDDLAEHEGALPASSLKTIRARLEELRAGAESDVLSGTMRGTLRAAMQTAELGIETWPVDDVTFAQLAERLADGYRRARAAIPQEWPVTDDETLHELRRRVVVHRYQMEVVEPLWPRMASCGSPRPSACAIASARARISPCWRGSSVRTSRLPAGARASPRRSRRAPPPMWRAPRASPAACLPKPQRRFGAGSRRCGRTAAGSSTGGN